MSLETLLEAAEYLEWSKSGKKSSSRELKSTRRQEIAPSRLISERKGKHNLHAYDYIKSEENIGFSDESRFLSPPDNSDVDCEQSQEDLVQDTDDSHLKDIKRCLGTRETHNKLEKNRRAHLKECFELLRVQLPGTDERRTSNLATLRSALRYIDQLVNQQKELENEKKRMQRLKTSKMAHITAIRKELKDKGVDYNIDDWIVTHDDNQTHSTSTASECGDLKLEGLKSENDVVTAPVVPSVAENPENLSSKNVIKHNDDIHLVIKAVPLVKPKTLSVNKPPEPTSAVIDSQTHAIQMVQHVPLKSSSHHKGKMQIVPASEYTNATHAIIQSTTPVLAMDKLQSAGASHKIIYTAKTCASNNTLQMGQVIVSNPNFVVAPFHNQTLTVNTAPMTVNLQAGRVITPRPPLTASVLTKSPDNNLSIAPKQLVLITTDHQRSPTAAAQVAQLNASAQTQRIGESLKPLNTIIPIATLGNIQAVKPATVITGVLPTTLSDGTISYLPITLTTKPYSTESSVSTSMVTAGLTFVLPSTTTAASMQSMSIQLTPSVISQTSTSSAAPATKSVS